MQRVSFSEECFQRGGGGMIACYVSSGVCVGWPQSIMGSKFLTLLDGDGVTVQVKCILCEATSTLCKQSWWNAASVALPRRKKKRNGIPLPLMDWVVWIWLQVYILRVQYIRHMYFNGSRRKNGGHWTQDALVMPDKDWLETELLLPSDVVSEAVWPAMTMMNFHAALHENARNISLSLFSSSGARYFQYAL